jgi:hypothetical protein
MNMAEEMRNLICTSPTPGLCKLPGATGALPPAYVGWEPDGDGVPDYVVTLYNSGGRSPNPKFLIDFPSVQVRVRGGKNGYTTSRAKAEAIKNYLLGLPSQTIGTVRWVSVGMDGDIADIGFDKKQRPLHTINFRMIVEPPVGTLVTRIAL